MYTDLIERPREPVRYGVPAKPSLYASAELFSRILENSIQNGTGLSPETEVKEIGGNENSNRVEIGTISEKNPTISDLLLRHPVFCKNCWRIIHAAANQNKCFTKLGAGTSIYLKPDTFEIVWETESEDSRGGSKPSLDSVAKNGGSEGKIFLGNLSREKPTVSHLLVDHPVYDKDCWHILSNGANRPKDFRHIAIHTPVYLNRRTGEITWGKQVRMDSEIGSENPAASAESVRKTTASENPPMRMEETDAFSERLARAVKPYIGTPYRKINCYELLVRGLEKVGIQYRGADGLGRRLIRKALAKGMPENHYLSGEGLIETSGVLVYAKSISKVRHPGKEATALYQEIEPLLKKGQILSFSTLTQGHTGVVSRRGSRWTYINSGNMDHNIAGRRRKGVGEESLRPEIDNWVRLAEARGETLRVTIGSLNEHKLKGFPDQLHAEAGENKV